MRIRVRATWTVLLIALLAAPHTATRARSQRALPPTTRGAGIRMQIDAGYGGNFRAAAWLPVRVRISNPGPEFSGTLRVDDTSSQGSTSGSTPSASAAYTLPVLMPQGGVKQFTLFVPAADLSTSVTLRLVGTDVSVVRQAAINSLGLGTIFAGVLSRNANAINQLKGGTLLDARVIPVRLSAATLDANPLALASFDLLVIDDFNTAELSPAQLVALDDWVREGGTLVEIGGPTAQATVGGLPAALQIVHPGQPLTLSRLPGLAAIGGSAVPPGSYVAATGAVTGGTVLLDQRRMRTATGPPGGTDAPLVVESPLGLGSVVYSAIDPTLGSLAQWQGLPNLWRLLAGTARSGAATTTTVMAGTQQTAQNATIDQEIDTISAPSFGLFMVLLAVYVLLLVPLNFVVLSRLRRRDLSWITLPAMVLILVGITFGSAYFGRGRNVRISVVSMLYLTSGTDRVPTQQYAGLFAPLAGDYTLVADDTRLLGAPLFAQGQGSAAGGSPSLQFSQDSGQVSMPQISMWSSRNAMSIGFSTYPGGLQGAVRAGTGGHLVGTITNRTGATVYGVVLTGMGLTRPIGDLLPDQTYRVDLTVGATPSASQVQQRISDYYGGTAAVVGAHPSRRNVALLDRHALIASLDLAPLTARLLAGGPAIPTNPDEKQSDRFGRIVLQSPVNGSPLSFGSLVAIGWTGQGVGGFRVNGDRVSRQDTTLLVQPIPIALTTGSFTIAPGSIPVRLAGSPADLTQGGFSSGGGFTINSQSSVVFVGRLPAPADRRRSLRVSSLTLDVLTGTNGAGGALGATSAALYDWQRGRWVAVDASGGEVSPRNPGRFVSASGLVRVQISAGDAGIGIADQTTGIALGARGEVR